MGKLCYLCNRKASKTENISLHSFPKDVYVRQKWLQICGLTTTDDVSRVSICSIHFADNDINRANTFGRTKSFIKPGAIPTLFITNPLIIGEVNEVSSTASDNVIFGSNEEVINTLQPPSNNLIVNDIVKEENTPCENVDNNNSSTTDIDTSSRIHDKNEINANAQDEHTLPTTNKRSLSTSESDENINITDPDCNGYCTPKTQRRRFFDPRFVSEIRTSDVATPRRAHRIIQFVQAVDRKKTKQIRTLQDQTRRLKKRIESLKDTSLVPDNSTDKPIFKNEREWSLHTRNSKFRVNTVFSFA